MSHLNVFHAKFKPKFIQYRNFNQFDSILFRVDLLLVQSEEFEKCIHLFSKVPIKEKQDSIIVSRFHQSEIVPI